MHKQTKRPKTSLGINDEGQIAFFYVGQLEFIPEWASLDVEQGELCIGGADDEFGGIKMDKIDTRIYEDIKNKNEIFVIGVHDDENRTPVEQFKVPFTVSTQMK